MTADFGRHTYCMNVWGCSHISRFKWKLECTKSCTQFKLKEEETATETGMVIQAEHGNPIYHVGMVPPATVRIRIRDWEIHASYLGKADNALSLILY